MDAKTSVQRRRPPVLRRARAVDGDAPDDAEASAAIESARVAGVRALRQALAVHKDPSESTLATMADLAVSTALAFLGRDADDEVGGLRHALISEFNASAKAH